MFLQFVRVNVLCACGMFVLLCFSNNNINEFAAFVLLLGWQGGHPASKYLAPTIPKSSLLGD